MRKLLICMLAVLGSATAFAGGPITQVQKQHNIVAQSIQGTVWLPIVTSLSKTANYVDVFTSSAVGTIMVGYGASGSEYEAFRIPGGGVNRTIPLRIPKGTRVSLKATTSTNGTVYAITDGDTILNFME